MELGDTFLNITSLKEYFVYGSKFISIKILRFTVNMTSINEKVQTEMDVVSLGSSQGISAVILLHLFTTKHT